MAIRKRTFEVGRFFFLAKMKMTHFLSEKKERKKLVKQLWVDETINLQFFWSKGKILIKEFFSSLKSAQTILNYWKEKWFKHVKDTKAILFKNFLNTNFIKEGLKE